eukprot:jgi/Chrzof1/5298/Cz15g21090.t1
MQAATTTTTDPEQRPSTSEMQQQQHSGLGALQQSKLMQEFLTSGVSVASGTVVTNPIDLVKTRMQLQQLQPGAKPSGMVTTAMAVVQCEGVTALWKGVHAAVVRGLVYGGLRLGLYHPIKNMLSEHFAHQPVPVLSATEQQLLLLQQQQQQHSYLAASPAWAQQQPTDHQHQQLLPGLQQGQQAVQQQQRWHHPQPQQHQQQQQQQQQQKLLELQPSYGVKLLAGTLSGGLAAVVSSPSELIKVRLQAAATGHSSAASVISNVVATDGVMGLWKGATPGLIRASVLTASQCATYDEVKRKLMAATGWADDAATHLGCALITGLVSTIATNPVDVVKTHMFMGGSKYTGPLHCAYEVYASAGLTGFFRGWTANYARLGPQTVVTFMVAERLRELIGLGSF